MTDYRLGFWPGERKKLGEMPESLITTVTRVETILEDGAGVCLLPCKSKGDYKFIPK